MVLRLGILLGLGCLVAAGPIAWDDSKCAQQCNGGTKFQYSEQTSYIYSFESSNEMTADGATDLSMAMKATVKISTISKCEMVLQITDVTSQHGPNKETSSKFIEELKRNPLPFAWDDGKIDHVCPSPDDSNDVNNVKKAILSAFQNTMKSFYASRYSKEVDVLGSCDTHYSVIKEGQNDKYVFKKEKKIPTCTDHLKGHTLLLASFYESSSQRQHLPFLTGETLSCSQTVENGLIDEVTCEETASFKPLLDYGYVVDTHGKTKLKKVSSEPASRIVYRTSQKESLVFKHTPQARKDDNLEAEAQNILRSICESSGELLSKDAANLVHKLVYVIRGLSQEALERIYESLKSKQLCNSGKARTIFLDALNAASSGGSIGLLTKLVATGEIPKLDALLWLSLMPFTSYLEEESIAAAVPLLRKESANKQALLGVSAMTYKYCSVHDGCENSKAVKDVSDKLKQLLGDKCQAANKEEETQIITALKAFGNLGFVGESADSLFECASLSSNNIPIRISAIEAFRRAPCTENIVSKLLDVYKNKNEDDEVRIASLISLSRCPTSEIIRQVLEVYESETSSQVGVFTWSYLVNLQESSNPLYSKIQRILYLEEIETPASTDITKFSRNFQVSLFSEFLNLGDTVEANVIHSRNSFLPRSGNIGFKTDIFGNQLDLLEVGGRVEDLEYILEKLFGPRGLMPNLKIDDILQIVPPNIKNRIKRSADSYKSKIDALSERFGYSRGRVPHGNAYVRVLGHELHWLQLDKDMLNKYKGINIKEMLNTLASTNKIDVTKNLLYLDVSILFPSVTGRAYKLAGNLSSTIGIKGEGKLDLTQPDFPIPRADIEGSFQPSILTDASASFTIHSEDFEPGVSVETAITAGLSLDTKFEMKDGRLLHLKLKRRQDRQEIFSLKRTLYCMNHRGKTELPKPESYNLNYCTKYIQYFTGARYCASMTIPHLYNAEGKPKIPFVRAMEASLVVEETDKSMEGYEFLLEIPEWGKWDVRNYKFLLDTPNSEIDRKYAIDLNAKRPRSGTLEVVLNARAPFYAVDIDANVVNENDNFKLKIKALGNKKRHYELDLDVGKDVKGARLVEYSPRLSLTIPNVRPVEFSGTIVCAKGRKTQITINLNSNSFDSPVAIKGNLAKEGEKIDLDTDFRLHGDFNVTAFSQIHKMQTDFGNVVGKGLYTNLRLHYEPDGRSYESVSFYGNLENVQVRDRLSFNLGATLLLAEHQDLNSMISWDFSFKPLAHLKNDFIFRYGENFADDTHLVRVTQSFAFGGDFDTFQRMDIENKLGLTISCLNFNRSAALSLVWNLVEKPKFFVEVGVKSNAENEVYFKYDYSHVSDNPLKLASEAKIIYYRTKINYRNQIQEIASNEYQGKAVIETEVDKQINIDYMYRVKNDDNFHHELDATINFPGQPVPVQQKTVLLYSKDEFQFTSFTDTGVGSPYTLEIKSNRGGKSELSLNTAYVEGQFIVDNQASIRSIQADFTMKKVYNRKITIIGSLTSIDPKTLNLEVKWDGDKDAQNKVILSAKSNKGVEDGIEKYMISATINYVGAISVDVSGKVSTDLLRGPHYFRADYSGNDPMAIEFTHEIKNGKLESFGRYLKNDAERLRMDIKGRYLITGNKLELDGGIFTSSPYKSLDGKVISFGIKADSTDATRLLVAEYRIKPVSIINYAGKFEYHRQRGWPGHIRSVTLVTVHNRPAIEGNLNIDYGNGKYSIKSSFTPLSKRKIHFLSTFEHSARFAAFHHSLATSLQYLQTVELKAVADLRNMEDATVHSNFDVNNHSLYSVNSTLKMRSIIDFDGQLVILSKITPSLKLISRTQASGQFVKYEMNLDVDSTSLMTGSGEIKKRKKGFNGDMIFKYKEKEFLAVTVSQEAKSQRERNYVIKTKTPWRSHNANIKVNKDKKGSVKYETKFCREGTDQCISVDLAYKESGDVHEYDISYRRGEVDFNIQRIRVSTKELSRFHTVIYNGNIRYGYDLRLARESSGSSVSLGIILPSREFVNKIIAKEISLTTPKIKWEFSSDAKNHPDRKLAIDVHFENHLADNNPSKLDLIISHPIYEKPIEIKLVGDYQHSSNKFLTASMSLDYSTDPEDKIIAKLAVEKGLVGTATLNLYHKDEQHLDYVVKVNGTINENEEYLGMIWTWTEDSGDQEAHIIFHSLEKENKFYFDYKRPRFTYRLDGTKVSPNTLLDETSEIDFVSNYNGEVTKAKLINDYARGCYTLNIFGEEGETRRTAELCINDNSRKIVSVLIEGLDDEGQWAFEYSGEVIRKDWRTLRTTQNFNPEFLGQTLFKVSSLADELSSFGVGTLPISESPQYKKFKASFGSKVIQPSLRFFIPEVTKFVTFTIRDINLLRVKLVAYYHTLPPFSQVKDTARKLISITQAVAKEICDIVSSYYRKLFATTFETVDKFVALVKKTCNDNADCKAFVNAYQEEGFKGLAKQLKIFLHSIPDKIQEFLSKDHTELRNFLSKAFTILKGALQPLTKYRCGEIVVKATQLIYQKLEPCVQSFLRNAPAYYRSTKEKILSNNYVRQSVQFLQQSYFKIKAEVLKIDYRKLYHLALGQLEEFVLSINPSLPRKHFQVHAFNTEKGIADFEYTAASYSVPAKIGNYIGSIITYIIDKATAGSHTWKNILVKYKRATDLNFFPPYKAQAMILANQHYVTFDKEFYDFAGECIYLLTKDFDDGNFTFALKPKEGDKDSSILAIINDVSVELNPSDKSVLVGDSAVDLPYISKDFLVSRSGSTIIFDDRHGVQVRCNLVHQLCSFAISGWYFGKTAGLLGTYNYEPSDDFKRPKGQIANSATVFAKSWELRKGCKSNNLVSDVRINERSDYYKICKQHFVEDTSPLAACFSEVSPEDYMQLCLRHLARESDTTKALCRVSAAYVTECEHNYLELSLPSRCLTCTAPDGSVLQHSDKKKYENLPKKSADIVFIIEDHECNKIVMSDLGNLARSIDRELQNEGFKENMFGVVGYGGEIQSPEIFTINGDTFFNSRDINAIMDRMKMESTKVESSRAFEAMKLAVSYLFRSDTAKSFVLLSCSACKYDFKSLQYPVVQQILLERGISLHVIHSAEITVRKSSKEKDIIGADPDTVYHFKDVTQRDLVGEPALRSQVSLPKDLCIALSQDVNGSFFTTYPLTKRSSEIKNWRSVFARKFIKAVQSFQCQWCDCTSTRDHIPNTICHPCETKRPRLPFSVCRSCAVPTSVDVFLSYIRHLI